MRLQELARPRAVGIVHDVVPIEDAARGLGVGSLFLLPHVRIGLYSNVYLGIATLLFRFGRHDDAGYTIQIRRYEADCNALRRRLSNLTRNSGTALIRTPMAGN